MKAYTSSLSRHRSVSALNIPLLDITVKSGLQFLAPDWDFLMEYKNSNKTKQDEAIYTAKYKYKLSMMYKENPKQFTDLFNYDKVCFSCYCAGCNDGNVFCHRFILVEALKYLAKKLGLEYEYCGEIL